jgi:hypothetical protein
MRFSELIIESRIDDFKVRHGKKFSPQNVTNIVKTISPKYLDWVGKVMDDVNFDENFKTLETALKRFETISTNLPLTDINQYKTLNDLVTSIKTYDGRVRRDIKEVQGGKVVYDDGRYFVVNPLSYESSCYYGKGTKWCTAAETDTHFKRYNEDGKLFYIIDRTKPTNDSNYKVALLKKFDGEMSFWDAKDDRVKFNEITDKEKFEEIIGSVDRFLQEVYPEQLKIYADAVAAKKEKERLEKLRIQQEMRVKYNDAQERKEMGEWSVSFDEMESEGLMAHALLAYLDEYSTSVEVRTSEDNNEIVRLESEIQRLDDEYDNSEDPRPELLDQKYELEEELEELKLKIDVYNIIPTGETYYGLDTFEVLADGFDGRVYAIGSEYDTEKAALEYVESLIDDIGYEGFRESFLEEHIDENQLKRFVYDFYYDDLYNEPNAYINDEYRNLSDSQEEEINRKERTISKLELQISSLEDRLDGEDDDDINEKIEEFTEMISELEDEIEEIKNDPEGDFPDEIIEKEIQSRVDDAMYDPQTWMRDYGMNIKDFIDEDGFIQAVVDADGIGETLNRYDGSADLITVNNETFYVMRID